MWVMTSFGMFSASLRDPKFVAEGDNRLLQVRSRRYQDLMDLKRHYMPNAGDIVRLKNSDYEFRIYCTHEDWAAVVNALALDIDYRNFKNTVTDKALHDAYMRVWNVFFTAFGAILRPNRDAKRRRKHDRRAFELTQKKQWWEDIADPTDEEIFAQAEEMFPTLHWPVTVGE